MEEEKIITDNSAEDAVETPTVEEPVTPVEVAEPTTEAVAEEPVAEATAEEPVGAGTDRPQETAKEEPVAEKTVAEPVAQEEPVAEETTEATETTKATPAPTSETDEYSDEFSEEPAVAAKSSSTIPAQKAPRKKFKFKLWMAIAGAFLIGVLITGLVAGFWTQPALSADVFNGWESVTIHDAEGFLTTIHRNHLEDNAHADLNRRANELQQGLDATSHSLLTSWFMLNNTNQLRFRLRDSHSRQPKYNEDGYRYRAENGEWVYIEETNSVRQERTMAQVMTDTEVQSGTFMLDFNFPSLSLDYIANYVATNGTRPVHQPQYLRVRDNSTEARNSGDRWVNIYFNRIRVLINDSEGDITSFVLFVYNTNDFETGSDFFAGADEARVNPIYIRMRTHNLYYHLLNIREEFKFNRDNGIYIPTPEIGDGDNYEITE